MTMHTVCTEEQSPATELVKSVFYQLCEQRSANSLKAGREWFATDVTYFPPNENELLFVNYMRNYSFRAATISLILQQAFCTP